MSWSVLVLVSSYGSVHPLSRRKATHGNLQKPRRPISANYHRGVNRRMPHPSRLGGVRATKPQPPSSRAEPRSALVEGPRISLLLVLLSPARRDEESPHPTGESMRREVEPEGHAFRRAKSALDNPVILSEGARVNAVQSRDHAFAFAGACHSDRSGGPTTDLCSLTKNSHLSHVFAMLIYASHSRIPVFVLGRRLGCIAKGIVERFPSIPCQGRVRNGEMAKAH